MLGRDAAAAGDALLQNLASRGHGPLDLLPVALVEQQDRMDVAVAGMGHVDDADLMFLADLGRAANDLRQPRARHHAVLDRIAGTQPAGRADGRLAALPEQLPLLGRGCLQHFPGPEPLAELDDLLLLPIQSRLRPIDFDHQHRAGVGRKAELKRLFDRRQNALVHQFHRRGNDARRDDLADGVAGVVDRVEDGPHGR